MKNLFKLDRFFCCMTACVMSKVNVSVYGNIKVQKCQGQFKIVDIRQSKNVGFGQFNWLVTF